VIAVASTADEAFVESLGAKEVLGRSSVGDLVARFPTGVDAVLDTAGFGPPAIAVVRDGGVFVAVTDPGQPDAERGIRTDTVHVEPAPAQLAELMSAVAAGRLTTRVPGRCLCHGLPRRTSGWPPVGCAESSS
jgi:NADPH2:quinone reductase